MKSLRSFLKKIITIPFKIYHGLVYAYNQYEKNIIDCPEPPKYAHVGVGSIVQSNVYVSWPSRLYIGEKSIIQRDTIIHSMGGVHIGNYSGIGRGSILVSFSHNYLRPDFIPYDKKVNLKPIIIRDYVWIGFGVNILPGVEIGEGAIISMGATVTKNVPPLAVVMGNPAEIVGYRNKENFEQCKKEKRFVGLTTTDPFEESIPNYLKKKYKQELIDLGML